MGQPFQAREASCHHSYGWGPRPHARFMQGRGPCRRAWGGQSDVRLYEKPSPFFHDRFDVALSMKNGKDKDSAISFYAVDRVVDAELKLSNVRVVELVIRWEFSGEIQQSLDSSINQVELFGRFQLVTQVTDTFPDVFQISESDACPV